MWLSVAGVHVYHSVADHSELARICVILWEAMGLCDQHCDEACGAKATESQQLSRGAWQAASLARECWFTSMANLSGPVRFRISTETVSFRIQSCAEVT